MAEGARIISWVAELLEQAIFKDVAKDAADDVAKDAVKDLGADATKDVARDAGRNTAGDASRTRIAKPVTDPRDAAVPADGRACVGDPVDVATGEVVLSQVDVELAGVLPLVVSRTHVSSYRAGGLFGLSWASTLDERLEVDGEHLWFASADGMLLRYPRPEPGPVLPVEGPRLPLVVDEHGYTITDPQRGSSRRFAVRPGHDAEGGVLPLVAISDRNGNKIDVDHRADGSVAQLRHSGGYRIAVETTLGRVTALRLASFGGDGGLVLVRYRYDEAGRLAEVINSTETALRFSYDGDSGRLAGWQDRNDCWYRYSYDADGRCAHATGPGGVLARTFGYDPEGKATTVTDSLGHVSSYRLNQLRQVVAEVNPLGQATVSQWDRHERLLARTDAVGRTTRYSYDDANLVAITRPDGTVVTASYNNLRQPVRVTEADGTEWRYSYDDRGNLTSVRDPAGAVTTYVRGGRGELTGVIDGLGRVSQVTTDAAGLPVAVTGPDGATTQCARDPFGRVAAVTDPAGGVTKIGWTAEGNPAWRIQPDGATERWSYDGEGNLIEQVNAAGQLTRVDYTNFDLPARRANPDGSWLEFGYDTELRLVTVTNSQGLTWRYDYDPVGNLAAETDFNGHTVHYRYDGAGQLIERINGTGQTTQLVRDLLGNIVEKRAGDHVTTYAYDAAGWLVSAAGPDAEIRLERDAFGRVTAETCNGHTLISEFDAAGQRVRRVTPSGSESKWHYDPAGHPAALQAAGHTIAFTHDPAGREVERRIPGATLAQQWDLASRLTAQTLTAAGPSTGPSTARLMQQRTYTWRPDGLLTGVQDHLAGPRSLGLDPAGRITAVTGADWAESYAYDDAGNITAANWPAPAGSAAGPAAAGRREYTGTLIRWAGRIRYEHDAAGRVTLRQHATLSGRRTWRYTWDADDQLSAVVTPDGQRWAYRYDPLGRRIAKQRLAADGSVAEELKFVWDGLRLAEQATTGESARWMTWDYRPDSFTPIAQSERASRVAEGTPSLRDAPQDQVDRAFYAIVTDLIGTPAELIDADGNLAWHRQDTLWGAAPRPTSGPDCPLRFPGQYHDPESGLNYNYHRYYDPTTARYFSPDPLGLAPAPNPHAYVPNPTLEADPLGLAPCVWDRIKTTQAPRDLGSALPKSFELTTSSGAKVWVAPNATKHIWEETRGLMSSKLVAEQARLAGLADAVDTAASQGIGNWERLTLSKGWELIFSQPRSADLYPVLKHARYMG